MLEVANFLCCSMNLYKPVINYMAQYWNNGNKLIIKQEIENNWFFMERVSLMDTLSLVKFLLITFEI